MPRATWDNLTKAAINQINSQIESVGRAASWDNPALATWASLNNSVDMELMRRRAQWNNLGMTDEELLKEMLAEMQAAQQAGGKR